VRDSKARAFLSQLHVDIAQRSPSAAALAAVTAFAKATGDYAALSLNDLRVPLFD
jgi:RNA-binding protein NOB1